MKEPIAVTNDPQGEYIGKGKSVRRMQQRRKVTGSQSACATDPSLKQGMSMTIHPTTGCPVSCPHYEDMSKAFWEMRKEMNGLKAENLDLNVNLLDKIKELRDVYASKRVG